MKHRLSPRSLRIAAGATLIGGLLTSGAVAAATAAGTIVEVGMGYGNLQTDVSAENLGLTPGDRFTFTCREATFPATWAEWYSDVPEGEWLGLSAGGRVQIAVSFGDANARSGCGEGDAVTVATE
jgi:S-adenosylmethionine hydrolase